MYEKELRELEKRFQLIQRVYERYGTAKTLPPQVGKVMATLGKLFSSLKSEPNTPAPLLPEFISYSILNQNQPGAQKSQGELVRKRPQLALKDLLKNQTLINQLNKEMANGLKDFPWDTGKTQKFDAKKFASGTLPSLLKAISTGDLNDWLEYFKAQTREGLGPLIPQGRSKELFFWSGKGGGIMPLFVADNVGSSDTIMMSGALNLNVASGTGEVLKKELGNQVWVELVSISSSLYATMARGDVVIFLPIGLSVGNFFWNAELPILRELQREGVVRNIYVYNDNGEPPDYDSASSSQKMETIYRRCVQLTSKHVDISVRRSDDSWQKLPVKADFIVNMLLKANGKVIHHPLYAYRLQTNIWAKLKPVSPTNHFLQLTQPGLQDAKFIQIFGYTTEELTAGKPSRLRSLELILFKDYMSWDSLPTTPNFLVYTNDALFLQTDKGLEILYLKVDGAWRNKELITQALIHGMRLGNQLASGGNDSGLTDFISKQLDGTPGEDAENASLRAEFLRGCAREHKIPQRERIVSIPRLLPSLTLSELQLVLPKSVLEAIQRGTVIEDGSRSPKPGSDSKALVVYRPPPWNNL